MEEERLPLFPVRTQALLLPMQMCDSIRHDPRTSYHIGLERVSQTPHHADVSTHLQRHKHSPHAKQREHGLPRQPLNPGRCSRVQPPPKHKHGLCGTGKPCYKTALPTAICSVMKKAIRRRRRCGR